MTHSPSLGSRRRNRNTLALLFNDFATEDIAVIPTTSEKFISFQIGNLRFLDSLQFLSASLDTLVQTLVKGGTQKFPNTERH